MFPIIGLGEPYIPRFGGVLQECGYFTWRVSDCEELVGPIAISIIHMDIVHGYTERNTK